MFVLLESTDQGFINALHDSLQSHGIVCLINTMGSDAAGSQHFAIQLAVYSQMEYARRLLFRSPGFAHSLHPEFLPALLQVRAAPRQQVLRWLTSTWALRLSALCLAAVALGLLGDALLK